MPFTPSEANKIRNSKIQSLTPGLKRALVDFIVSGSIKKDRLAGEVWERTHHTMMVHATHSVPAMKPIAIRIDKAINSWKVLIHEPYDSDFEDLDRLFRDSWEDYSDEDFDMEKVSDFIHEIQPTRLLNSEKDDEVKEDELDPDLDFDSARVIGVVVGGNLLSRGLTVEGLTISYFVRPAGTYDAAIQMCRWNGIRSSLDRELIRVHLTGDMRSDYQWLNLVEKDLRED